MSQIFSLVVIIILAVLALLEVGRYLAARRGPDEFPYPGRRLARRLAVAFLFSSIVGLAAWWPRVSPWVQLGLLTYVLVGMALGLALLWRDLRETSLDAVAQAARLNEQTGEAFMSLLRQKQAEKDRSGGEAPRASREGREPPESHPADEPGR